MLKLPEPAPAPVCPLRQTQCCKNGRKRLSIPSFDAGDFSPNKAVADLGILIYQVSDRQ